MKVRVWRKFRPRPLGTGSFLNKSRVEREGSAMEARPPSLESSMPSLEEALIDLKKDADDLCVIRRVDEEFKCELSAEQARELSDGRRQSFVVVLQSNVSGRFSVIWRNKLHQDDFCLLNVFDCVACDDLLALCRFITRFLANCLNSGHTGLSSTTGTKTSQWSNLTLTSLATATGKNLLMSAAEEGDTQVVKILLQIAFSANERHDGLLAVDLAYSNKNFVTALALLEANSPFPQSFTLHTCADEKIKSFALTSQHLHDAIRRGDPSEVGKLVAVSRHLRHFFSLGNDSAMMTALTHKRFDIYELLLSENLSFAHGEPFRRVVESLSEEERRCLREIHFRHKKDMQEPHLIALLARCSVGHGSETVHEKFALVADAFRRLDAIPTVRTILRIAACFRHLHLVFDFERNSVFYLDPTADTKTAGIFYLNGRIYVGARQLLNPDSLHEVLETIAHELCHFVLFNVFENEAKPYAEDEAVLAEEFALVCDACERKKYVEEIIALVFECYGEDMHHAELIVRVPHIEAHYLDAPMKAQKARDEFRLLFNFYEQRVQPRLEKAAAKLEKKRANELSKKNRLIGWLVFALLAILMLLPVFGTIAYFWIRGPDCRWETLRASKQLSKVFDGRVSFSGETAAFGEIFGRNESNADIFSVISSQQLCALLENRIPLDLDQPANQALKTVLFLNYKNATESLKKRIRNATVNFQGKTVKLHSIAGNSTKIYEIFDAKQTMQLIRGEPPLKIANELKNDTIFYVQRKFIEAGVSIFDEFWDSTLGQYVDVFSDNDKRIFEISPLKLISDSNFVLLSDEAGSGKTVSFKQLALELKQKFPLKWVQFIDLKAHIVIYKSIDLKHGFLTALSKIFNANLSYEREIFENLYKNGSLIVLWDGFDEISPTYSDTLLSVFEKIKDSTKNVQFLSSRKLYEKKIKEKMNCTIYHLFPYLKAENEEFLEKFYRPMNLSETQLEKARKNVVELTKKVQEDKEHQEAGRLREFIEMPLLLRMIAEISVDTTSTLDTANLFSIYKQFLQTKANIAEEKKTLSLEQSKALTQTYTASEVLQFYAIEFFFKFNTDFQEITSNLSIVKKFRRNITKIDINGLLRFGVIVFDSEGRANFVHRTFAEYLVAQYFVNNVYEVTWENDPWTIKFMLKVLTSRNENLKIQEFVEGYLKLHPTYKIDPQVSEILERNGKKLFYETMYSLQYQSLRKFLKFLPLDDATFERLWRFRDNGTLATFYAVSQAKDLLDNFDEIEMPLRKKYANQREKIQELIFGKDQRGTFMLGAFKGKYFKVHSKERFNLTEFFARLEIDLSFDVEEFYRFEYFDDFYDANLRQILTTEERKNLFLHSFLVFDRIKWRIDNALAEIQQLFTSSVEIERIVCKKTEFFSAPDYEDSLLHAAENFSTFGECLRLLDAHCSSSTIFSLLFSSANHRLLVPVSAIESDDFLPTFWIFVKKHTGSKAQQQAVLTAEVRYHIRFSEYTYSLFAALIHYGSAKTFNFTAKVYEELFSESEMVDICRQYLKSEPALTAHSFESNQVFVGYLSEKFSPTLIKNNFGEALKSYYRKFGGDERVSGNFTNPTTALLRSLISAEEFEAIVPQATGRASSWPFF